MVVGHEVRVNPAARERWGSFLEEARRNLVEIQEEMNQETLSGLQF